MVQTVEPTKAASEGLFQFDGANRRLSQCRVRLPRGPGRGTGSLPLPPAPEREGLAISEVRGSSTLWAVCWRRRGEREEICGEKGTRIAVEPKGESYA